MNDLIIKQAKLINGDRVDIIVNQGKISAIHPVTNSDLTAKKQINLNSQYFISAGWIDAHTHCYSSSPIYFDQPDLVGIAGGVTTIIDAGSVGADDIDHFYSLMKRTKTHVYSFLNIARTGIITQNELSDMNKIDDQSIYQAIKRYPDFIIGLKARMSKSVIGENGIQPLIRAKEIQKESGLPLMVHIGNSPPDLEEIADLLATGDIITHCFNGKPNRILDQNGYLKPVIQRALIRGVILDVGHGSESFSFSVAEQAMKIGVYPGMISSDIYHNNRVNGPVYSLATVMTKFLCLGFSPKYILDCVTIKAANILHLKGKGHLAVGCDADITIFDIKNEKIEFFDEEGQIRTGRQKFIPVAVIIAGEVIATKEGREYGINLPEI
ncbi:amidohydrolase/deacetylase family metallohydrolase [Photorhabdus luminescens]|uniref:amidohydrolase/deacetylase family metallohydrolase n=1 Tax=Photorhabdus luminescens TaxID=29488 RepID=UPI0022403A9E|nr:amidohydrolase/deacetylase family metallohydrolase [Photorhabdus luminescens]MCW7761621.1 amidohydrolase/deacetylase family metallohydrolase [Photorhabdus luminescens subsp. venezuelensis]